MTFLVPSLITLTPSSASSSPVSLSHTLCPLTPCNPPFARSKRQMALSCSGLTTSQGWESAPLPFSLHHVMSANHNPSTSISPPAIALTHSRAESASHKLFERVWSRPSNHLIAFPRLLTGFLLHGQSILIVVPPHPAWTSNQIRARPSKHHFYLLFGSLYLTRAIHSQTHS